MHDFCHATDYGGNFTVFFILNTIFSSNPIEEVKNTYGTDRNLRLYRRMREDPAHVSAAASGQAAGAGICHESAARITVVQSQVQTGKQGGGRDRRRQWHRPGGCL